MEYKIKVNNISHEDEIMLSNNLHEGQIVEGVVTNIKNYGVFVKLKNGITGLIHIEDLSVARIKTPYERVEIGQNIKVMIKYIDKESHRLTFSYKELLGTWEDNAEKFKEGIKVSGIARETEKNKNGIFVELAPNLVGLAEYKDGIEYGQNVDVYIKKIIPEKHKVKLIII